MMNMKKIMSLTLAAVMFLSINSNAQFSKGTIMLGTTIGSTGYSSANSDYGYDVGTLKSTGTNTFTFSVGPQVGVFLSPHLVLGATPAFNITTSHVNSTTTNTNSTTTGSTTSTTTITVSLGPFLRYYFDALSDNNWLYGQINGAAGSGSGTSSGNSYTTNSTGNTDGKVSNIFTWNAGASIGLTHFFYKRIGMDMALGYSYSHVHNYDTNNTYTTNKTSGTVTPSANNYTLNTATNGVTFGLGFHWFLRG
jgi:Outer membrane protein beta-barrel domain